MKVKLKQSKFYYVAMGPGDVVEVPDDLGNKWVEDGHATIARDADKITAGLELEEKKVDDIKTIAAEVGVRKTNRPKNELIEETRTQDALKEGE